MRRLTSSVGLIVLALIAMPAPAQEDRFAGVEIIAEHAGGNVHMLQGSGGNIGVSVGPDGILIIDDQFAPLADKIRAALEKLGKGKLRFVLNTHWHGDHTGGNEVFGPEAPVIAHDNVRKRMSTRQELLGRVTEPSPEEALPVVTFNDRLTVYFNGEEIKVIHLPHGHTDGDSVILFTGSNVVHMGDDFFSGSFPFVDLASGGDVEGLTRHIEKLIGELPSDVKIIPGHGPLSGLDDLEEYHRMLVATAGIVRKRIAAGKSLDQIKEEGLPEEWGSWGSGFIDTDRWLSILHASLSR